MDIEERTHDAAMWALGLALSARDLEFERRPELSGPGGDVYVAPLGMGRTATLVVPPDPSGVVGLTLRSGLLSGRVAAEIRCGPAIGIVGNPSGSCSGTAADRPVRNDRVRDLMVLLARAGRELPGEDLEVGLRGGAWEARPAAPRATPAGP